MRVPPLKRPRSAGPSEWPTTKILDQTRRPQPCSCVRGCSAPVGERREGVPSIRWRPPLQAPRVPAAPVPPGGRPCSGGRRCSGANGFLNPLPSGVDVRPRARRTAPRSCAGRRWEFPACPRWPIRVPRLTSSPTDAHPGEVPLLRPATPRSRPRPWLTTAGPRRLADGPARNRWPGTPAAAGVTAAGRPRGLAAGPPGCDGAVLRPVLTPARAGPRKARESGPSAWVRHLGVRPAPWAPCRRPAPGPSSHGPRHARPDAPARPETRRAAPDGRPAADPAKPPGSIMARPCAEPRPGDVPPRFSRGKCRISLLMRPTRDKARLRHRRVTRRPGPARRHQLCPPSPVHRGRTGMPPHVPRGFPPGSYGPGRGGIGRPRGTRPRTESGPWPRPGTGSRSPTSALPGVQTGRPGP